MVTFLVLVSVGSSGGHLWHGSAAQPVLTSLADGLVGGAFVAGSVGAALVTWRRHGSRLAGWVVATGALISAQSLAVTILAFELPPPRSEVTFALLIGVAALGLACLVGLLVGLDRAEHVVDDSFLVGLGMGLTASGYLVLQFPLPEPPPAPMVVLAVVLVSTHVAAAALVLGRRTLTGRARALVAVTVLVMAAGLVVRWVGLTGGSWELVTFLARAGVGAAWFGTAWSALQRAAEVDDQRFDAMNHVLVTTNRDQRERMHELRSTVAGLVTGSSLLDDAALPPETRERLWRSVRRELDRMERMLVGTDAPPADIHLESALNLILDLQRLKGRRVELRGAEGVVHGRYDALAEVVNILMDNAVTHGGSDDSVVEVVRRDDETIDIRVSDNGRGIPEEKRTEIFEWGRRGEDSPGEGIGLHVAQRLMTEDGGSLSLAEQEGPSGSSFVISLPAARRSTENDLAAGGAHVGITR